MIVERGGSTMSKIQFIIGRTGTGKTHQILNEINQKCSGNPLGHPIFIITPEQMTFHTEYQLLRMNETNSLIRANALSFNRLAHRIMQEVGGLTCEHLDEVGKAMLLQKIMLAKNVDLGIFKNHIKKPGFIKKMDELFSEFKSHLLDTDVLNEKLNQSNASARTKEKISLLANIYDEFNAITLAQYLTTEDYFLLLIDRIEKSDLIKYADIYIDGYHTFNPVELAIIEKLAKHSRTLTIALTADLFSTDALWQTTNQTYTNLKKVLQPFNPKELTLTQKSLTHPATAHIEQHFMQSKKPSTITSGIHLFNAPTTRLEIEEVAKRIHYLSHHQKNGFSNIAIYTADLANKTQLFETIFKKHNLPYFFDHKESMLSHPVINLLHKVFQIFATNWRQDAIFETLKTGLFLTGTWTKNTIYEKHLIAHLEDIDKLENYVLARNIKKHHWVSGEHWQITTIGKAKTIKQMASEYKLNKIKNQIATPLINFELTLKKKSSAKKHATTIFNFLEELDIPQKLQLLAKTSERHNNQKETKQHEQVWNKLLQILEQIVEVANNDDMLLEDFIQMFKTGLEQLTYATIPATLDSIQIGDITRSRYQLSPNYNDPKTYGLKHIFIIGINDGNIPQAPIESSLLSEKERQIIQTLDIELAPSLINSQQNEIFSLYTQLSSAQKSITLSYTTEKNSQPSYIFTQLRQLFPAVELEEISTETTFSPNEKLTTPQALFEKILCVSAENPLEGSTNYQQILEYFKINDRIKYDFLLNSTKYQNIATKLLQQQAKELYTENIEASISRIEMFNQCQFAHFMRYGLNLKERDIFELTVADIGNLYHETLKFIALELKKNNRTFASINSHEIKGLASMATEATIKKNAAFAILKTSNRMQQIKIKLENVVAKTLTALAFQSKKSDFTESYFELKFASQLNRVKKNVANQIKLPSKKIGDVNFSLKGIIDRIDIAKKDDKTYVRVVDYKSSPKELDLGAIYYAWSLQLLTYLDVATNWLGEKTTAAGATAAGALYFHLHNPYTKDDTEILTKENLESTLLEKQTADFKMTGYIPNDHEILHMSDKKLEAGKSSEIIPVTLLAKGGIRADRSKTLQPEDFKTLRLYTNQKIEEAVHEILKGNLKINPKTHNGKTPCKWCKFKPICKIDEKPSYLPKIKPELALEKIKAEINGDENER